MFARFDAWLIRRVFSPVAHYIDYRWHRNNYAVAAWLLQATVTLYVVLIAVNVIRDGWGVFLDDPFAFVNIPMFVYASMQAAYASEAYERRPDIMPAQAMFLLAWPRLFYLMVIGVLCAVNIGLLIRDIQAGDTMGIIHSVGLLYGPVAAIAFYFAAIPKPPAKRKEKRAADFSGALQPSPVSS